MTSILIVEDESIVAWDIQETLENLGYQVLSRVSSGEEAIQLSETNHPDLVLMDIRLDGEMNGIQAAQEIYTHLGIPIIYLTAHADEQTLGEATTTNPFGYLVKPFRSQELHTTIQVALRRHRLDQEAQSSHQQLTTTLASIGDAMVVTDEAGKVTFMNPVAERWTGWSQEEATGQDAGHVCCLLHPESQEALEPLSGQAMNLSSAINVGTAVLRSRHGSDRVVGDSSAPITNDQGEVVGSVLVLRDMTEHYQRQQQIQERNQHLEDFQLRLISQLRESTTQFQEAIACLQVLNRMLRSLSTFSSESELLQTLVTDLGQIFNADYCWIALHDEKYAIASIHWDYLGSHWPPDVSLSGTEIDMKLYPNFYRTLLAQESWISPPSEILPSCYSDLGTVLSQRLITPVLLAQPTSSTSTARVIGEVGLITTEKQEWHPDQVQMISNVVSYALALFRQPQSLPAQQMALDASDRLNRLKEDFISSVSHELRTPLTNIKMATEMLRNLANPLLTETPEPLPPGQRQSLRLKIDQYFQILADEWQREFDLINALLDFQSLETFSKPLVFIEQSFRPWIAQIFQSFVYRATREGRSLVYRITSDVKTVQTHFPTLERIVVELLDNACKYTPPNQKINILVSTSSRPRRLKISVTSMGVEIAAEELERIFQPFYRVQHLGTWNHRGTGLGLALTRKLVERLGGEIRADSDRNMTTFTVTLPL